MFPLFAIRHSLFANRQSPIAKVTRMSKRCDCALVHIIDMRDVRGGTEMRFRRDNRATAAARRAFRFERDDES